MVVHATYTTTPRLMIHRHPRSTDPIYIWPDLVITFDRSGDPILPDALRSGTGVGIFCEGGQWDEDQMISTVPILWSDGLRR